MTFALPASVSEARPLHLGVWLMLALAWFATMGFRPLLEPDEGRYAEIPREMSVTGDWITPRLNGVKYFEKPPLQYWATAGLYSLVGFSEGSARLWSCGLAFLCLPLVFLFARSEYHSQAAGIAALLALALNPFFAVVGQLNLLDSALAFFLTATLFAFLRAKNASGGTERRWMLVAALSLALATLSKGLVAPVLAGGTVLIHMLVTRDVLPWRRWHLHLTIPVYFAVTAPWFVAVSLRNPEFADFFFVREHFGRYLTDMADRVEPAWYFLPVILLAVLPWIRPFFAAIARLRHARLRNAKHSTAWFLAIWCLFTVVFFSISHSKLATYVLPVMPPLAVLMAPYIATHIGSLRTAAWVCCAIVVLTAFGLGVVAFRKASFLPDPLVIWAAVAAILAIAGGLSARRSWKVPAITALLAFQALMISYSSLPAIRTAKPLAGTVLASIGTQTQLFSVNQYRQSLPPYLGRTLRLAMYRGELDFGLAQDPGRFIPTLNDFETEWRRSTDAVAFVEPSLIESLRARGVPLRELARDDRTIAIARQ